MKNILILGIVAGVIFLMIQFPHTMLSPGELVQGHQELNNNCFACHTPFGGIENNKCIACHKLSEIGKEANNGNNILAGKEKVLFHENLSSQSCMACHTDHKGLNPEIKLNGFKHTLLSETILNNCVSCHQKPKDNLHQSLKNNCNACHSTDKWVPANFDHDRYFALDGDHNASRNTCHKNNNYV